MEAIKEGDVMVDEVLAAEHGWVEWLDLKPFPNEHAARLKAPGAYKRFRRENNKFGSGLHAIWGVRKDNNKVELQAIRFDKTKFSVAQAKAWLKDHDYKPILFEPASEEDSMASNELAFTSEQVQALAAGLDPEAYPKGPMSYKTFPFEIKEGDVSEEGIFEGYGSTFGNRDLGDDIVVEGAFADSVRRHNGRGPTVKMLWQHDWEQPIGVWREIEEDSKGLRMVGQLLIEVQRAREAYVLIRAKALDGLSIGYQTEKAEADPQHETVRRLLKLNLWETSPVTFPMNPKARVRRVKSVRELEHVLRDAGLARREAMAIASHGFRGVCQRDSGADIKALNALAEGIAELHKALRSSDRG